MKIRWMFWPHQEFDNNSRQHHGNGKKLKSQRS